MKAAAFVNLKVHSCCMRVVKLHTIHAQIVFARSRVLCVNERECEERSAVLLPCRQHGKFTEPRRFVHDLRDRRAARVTCSEFQSFKCEETMLPELCGARRQKRLGNLHKL